MIRSTSQIVHVIGSTKFRKINNTHFAGHDAANTLVTDNDISGEYCKIFLNRHIELINSDQEDTNQRSKELKL
jgi:DeoR/GlpR family transcriptional regulator of sugar metabolism